MTMTLGRSALLRSIAAAILAGMFIFSALHAAAPHHSGLGPCVACQTLSAPAIVLPAETPGRPPAEQGLDLADRRDLPSDSSTPRLRPLRAPPPTSPA